MNCATHGNTAAVAYCRTCGKPLCAACTREVRGTIFCESCLADRLTGVVPPAPTVVPPPPPVPPVVPLAPMTPGAAPVPPYAASGPNPALAGILAGFFPFGVGAVYAGQYAKGLAHLVIFSMLIWGVSSVGHGLEPLFGLGIAFFYVYQIVDAVRTARAIQLGQPAPDPFGLAQSFGAGEKVDSSKIPMGALVLIGLGVLFLLHTIGIFEFGFTNFWPFILIFLGGWLFARRWGLLGHDGVSCQCDRCRMQQITGPAVIFTFGVLFLLSDVSSLSIWRTWPLVLLVVGGIKLLQSHASMEGHVEPAPPVYPASPASPLPTAPAPPAAAQHSPTSEVNNV
jgi:hypothetical protein